jgi:TolB-like protein
MSCNVRLVRRLALLDNGLWVDVRMIVKATATDSAELEVFQPTLLDGLDGLVSTDDGSEVRIAAARRLLQIDSAHDGAWQALIDAHLARGERGAAMLALQRYSATLSSAGFDGLYGVQLKGTSFRATGDTVRLRVMPPRVLDTTPGDNPLPGLAEEVTAAVSRFRWISSFVEAMYDPTAGYLLDSTLQYSGNRLRIIARLLDLHAGNEVIWARRLDRPMDDLLLLQGEVAAELAAQIDPELLLREGERRNADSGNSTALTLTLRAIPAIYRLEAARFRGAGELLAAATAMDAGHAAAHAWWAYWHLFLVGQGWADDPAGATRHAGELAERAVTLDPSDARALALVGHVRAFLQRRPEEACALHERALSLNPNLPLAWCFSGLAHSYLGEHELAIEQIVRAQYLSPHDPHAFFFLITHFPQSRNA